MCQNLFLDTIFFNMLLKIDRDVAEKIQQNRCPYCGGPLHQAHYPRKPRGAPEDLDASHCLRFSFCCGREGCRKRVMPPSVRFLGRKVFFAPIVLLLCSMMSILSSDEALKLRSLYQTSRRTVYRWRSWWQNEFASSRVWRGIKGYLSPPPQPVDLPGSLLNRFAGDVRDQLISCLKFLTSINVALAT